MNHYFRRYANKVVRNIGITGERAKKIREDIVITLESKSIEQNERNPNQLMGSAESVAEEFRVNMNLPPKHYFEYISDYEMFGIPLIHINSKRNGMAKGIIAIGAFSVGVISVGGFSLGVFSIGGFSLGLLFAFGGGAIAPLGVAMGGLAIGHSLAIGGYATANSLAIGGFAKGQIAIGDEIEAVVGGYKTKGTGENVFNILKNKEAFFRSIKDTYPNLTFIKQWIIEKAVRYI